MQATGKIVSSEVLAAKQKNIDQAVSRTQDIIQARKKLGYVYGSGGTDRISSTKSPMDWAVVKASPGDAVWSHMKELNKVGIYLHISWYKELKLTQIQLPPIVFDDSTNTATTAS